MNRTLVGLAVVSLSVLLYGPVAEADLRRIDFDGGAPRRHALVIGNGAYQADRLTNPVPDAEAMAEVLGELGFAVTLLTDATRRQMRQAVRTLRGKLRGPDIGLFYFAGHGVQVEGENYLIPVGAEMSKEEDVEDEAVRAQWVLSALQGRGSGTSLMILDACRNNPFARSFRSATRGLATMRARGGALIAYATGPGDVAADGAGRHSPYTGALVEHLRQPGVGILDVFTAVNQSVLAATDGKQEPWIAASLQENFVLGGSSGSVAQPQPSQPREDVQAADPARAVYAAAQEIGTEAAYEVVIMAAPDSPYAQLARAAITQLRGGGSSGEPRVMASGPPAELDSPRPPVRPQEWTNSIGMEFVLIEAGTFEMGSRAGEAGRFDNETRHTVTLSQGYYLGKYEVTQEEWATVLGTNPSRFSNCGACPVEQVSWYGVQSFIEELNYQEEGTSYRLPTEAEWEYAARGGTQGAYHFGDAANRLGQYAWCGENSGDRTHPVGQKRPNQFGLYDMLGNVWEWTADWYGVYPRGAVTDPRGPSSGPNRVLRGGCWDDNARHCRAANRHAGSPGGRGSGLGFRLARTP